MRSPLGFLAGSCAIHAALLGLAWAVWGDDVRRIEPAVVRWAITPVAELAPPPETLPDDVSELVRPRDDEVAADDPPPLDPAWEPEFDTVIAIADVRSDSFHRAPRGPVRRRGAPGGSGDGAGSTRSALPPAAAPAPTPVPPLAQAEPAPRPAPRAAAVVDVKVPVYPESARAAGVHGTVLVEADVLADGTVGDVRVVRSSGSRVLDDAAVAAVRRWRFEPATDGVAAIASTVRLPPIRFRLDR